MIPLAMGTNTPLFIVVINVRKKIKNVNKRVFYEKNKKTFVNVIKNVTLFSPAFGALTKSLTLTIW